MKKTIAVVDDDDIYRIIVRKMISISGLFETDHLFNDPQMALKSFKEEGVKPDVILLDVNMPSLDGWEFLDNLKSCCPDVYHSCDIYIVTSSIYSKDQERAKSYKEVKGFISKPINQDILKKVASTTAF
ncbi:response regulator [Salinimicrobium sp. HB62]|uniref:response regulator n=1 Tax=Salinimicrobium sp. HB62 TaxID=3077781 RepID=UPI002D78B280|nr:response regulator [Salinimicrobium sp. HB62]